MARILPLVIILIGLGLGGGLGFVLRPEATQAAPEAADGAPEADETALATDAHDAASSAEQEQDYIRLNNQFVVPIVHEGKVAALVVLSLSLQVQADTRERVYSQEPKLRDVFLSVLFEHANAGGFDGTFTATRAMDALRRGLLESAQGAVGTGLVTDVLIMDIVRQDLG